MSASCRPWVSPPPWWMTPPPPMASTGSRYSTRHAVVITFGRRTENDAVTTEYDPPHRAAMRGTSPNAPFLVTLTFAQVGDDTSVDVTSEIWLRGVARVFGPLVGAVYGYGWSRGLANLKLEHLDAVQPKIQTNRLNLCSRRTQHVGWFHWMPSRSSKSRITQLNEKSNENIGRCNPHLKVAAAVNLLTRLVED